jgi:MinD-like ATPase involved in chromosome partitioning or flagellar assembly
VRIPVTVEHGHGRLTLSLPDDVAVESLLPLMLDACGADGSATWTLLPRGGGPVDARRTLREAGVWPGAVVALHLAGPGEHRRPPVTRAANLSGLPRPLARWRRLGVAVAAAAGLRRAGAGRGPAARVRAAWDATDHVTRLERAIAAPPRQGVVIAVASIERDCGKTTIASLLAMVLTGTRADPPLAVDADPASRSLSRVLAPRLRLAGETYLDVLERRLRLGDLPLGAGGPHAAAVLPAPEQPVPELDATSCTALLAQLRADWDVVLLDCPAGFATPWAQAAWAAADQFVLVADERAGGPAALAPMASTLDGAGVTVAVVANRSRSRSARAAAARGLHSPVVALPDDPFAAALLRGGALTWEGAPAGWRRAVAELTASLAQGWAPGD